MTFIKSLRTRCTNELRHMFVLWYHSTSSAGSNRICCIFEHIGLYRWCNEAVSEADTEVTTSFPIRHSILKQSLLPSTTYVVDKAILRHTCLVESSVELSFITRNTRSIDHQNRTTKKQFVTVAVENNSGERGHPNMRLDLRFETTMPP